MLVINLFLICVVFKFACSQLCTNNNLGDIWKTINGGIRVCALNENDEPTISRACWEDWDRRESDVVCRSLDYPGVLSDGRGANKPRPGINFTCEGTEFNLVHCNFSRSRFPCLRLINFNCQSCSDTNPCPTTGVCNSTTGKCDCINECQNGGSCQAGVCTCPSEFHGDSCELCPKCQNGGICLSNGTCVCSSHFYGDYCENEPCELDCQNDGICINGECNCIGDSSGKYCQYCAQCQHGGICNLAENSCKCTPGYIGNSCESIICQPECSDKQICNNGSCECPTDSSGTNCTKQNTTPNIVATNSQTSKSQQTNTIPTQTMTQFSTKSSKNATSRPSDTDAFAAFPIPFVVPLVVIVIIIILTVLLILLLILCRSRYRKKKANVALAHAQNSPSNYNDNQQPKDLNSQNFVGPLDQLDCCTYEEIQQKLSSTANPYFDNNTLTDNTLFNNPLFSRVLEQPHVVSLVNGTMLQSTSFENPMYGESSIASYNNSDLYQKYEEANLCPESGSPMIVPRSDMRPLQTECIYANLDVASLPSAVENQQLSAYFDKEDIYWEPPNNLGLLFNQMSEKRFREIDRSAVELQDEIGSGYFGQVYKALWLTSGDQSNPFIRKYTLPVAVKTLHNQTTVELKTSFMQEAAIMGQFSHPNVLRLLGVVSRTEPLMIVTELMHTELLKFLFTIRSSSIQRSQILCILLEFSRQIASGMTYLSSKHFIHRDLAARNVLVANDLTCRVSDFGMSRQLREEGDYYTSKGGSVPLKWTSPEAIFFQRYSEKSDVWSFGMTLYEIWTLGEKPWYGYSNERVLEALCNSEIMVPPNGCPAGVASVMVQCWEPIQEHRPTFKQINELLSVLYSTC